MVDVIDLATINFVPGGGGGSGQRDPDYNVDYNGDFRAAEPSEE